MFIKTFLTIATIAVSAVTAFPGQELGGMTLLSRTGQCKGDMTYCGWDKTCKCDNDWFWDANHNECRRPPRPQPHCDNDQKCYCARSQDDWCEYNQDDDRCRDDGTNVIFCSRPDQCDEQLQQQCPPPQHCPDKHQHWCPEQRQCECKRGMVWANGRCQWPQLPKPECGEKLWCAKDNAHFCEWDDNNDWCHDNGKHRTFCCKDNEIKDQCQNAW